MTSRMVPNMGQSPETLHETTEITRYISRALTARHVLRLDNRQLELLHAIGTGYGMAGHIDREVTERGIFRAGQHELGFRFAPLDDWRFVINRDTLGHLAEFQRHIFIEGFVATDADNKLLGFTLLEQVER